MPRTPARRRRDRCFRGGRDRHRRGGCDHQGDSSAATFLFATLSKVQTIRASDVQRIQAMQGFFTTAAFLKYPRLRPLALLSIFTLARADPAKFFRRIAVMDEPCPLTPRSRWKIPPSCDRFIKLPPTPKTWQNFLR